MQKALLKSGGEECFVALVKVCSHHFALYKSSVLQTAAIPLDQAKVTIDKGAGGESGATEQCLREMTVLKYAGIELLMIQGFLGKILGFKSSIFKGRTTHYLQLSSWLELF